MSFIEDQKEMILSGGSITVHDAVKLACSPLDELCGAADSIRSHFCGNGFDLCSIVNAKCGKCSENCLYCAQSAHYCVDIDEYPLISPDEAAEKAIENERAGILRFSLVTSGRALPENEVKKVCEIIKAIRGVSNISVCGSFGLLNEEQFCRLKDAGLSRVHNNLETSRRFFPKVCTTHTYYDKLKAIRAAKRAGLRVCSGGIMGLGETMEDRIDLAFELRELDIRSIPLNMLDPIPGTPMGGRPVMTKEEMQRICALFRFINPTASIRLAGGRMLMGDGGEACFRSGANAAITMNMLTTSGITVKDDMKLLDKLDYKAVLMND